MWYYVWVFLLCYWAVELFDGYLVDRVVDNRGVLPHTTQTLQYKRGININQLLVYWWLVLMYLWIIGIEEWCILARSGVYSANEENVGWYRHSWGFYNIYSNYHVYIRESIVSMGWVHSKTIRLLWDCIWTGSIDNHSTISNNKWK